MTAPGSKSASVRRLAAQAHAVVIEIGPGGVVGRHPAAVAQLFVVISGEGWVNGGDESEPEPIRAGEAVLWERAEEHASGSERGMTAVVIEAETIDV